MQVMPCTNVYYRPTRSTRLSLLIRSTELLVNNLDSTSVVASNLVTTLDWRVHKVKKAAKAEVGVFEEVILRVIPLIDAEHLDTIVPSAGRMSF